MNLWWNFRDTLFLNAIKKYIVRYNYNNKMTIFLEFL